MLAKRNQENEMEFASGRVYHNSMNTVLDIGSLTRTEKLRAMEELWADLTQTEDSYPSPDWHGDVLRERDNALKTGRDEFVSWTEAKRIIREKKQ
jgi:hypothetical protein